VKQKRAVVVGFDYHVKFLSELINSEIPDWHLSACDSSRLGTIRAMLALRHADALITFGGPAPIAALIEAARRKDVPVIVIWAGSDIIKARENPFALEVVKQEHFINLSVAPWLVDELRDLGIEAEYLPVAAMNGGGHVKAFNRTFRVLNYLPEPRRDFYGASLTYEVARALPDVPFMVVGAGGRDDSAPPNVKFCGLVKDMQRRIDACTVLLRQPIHDGQSMLVLEAMARARHVIWNYEYPAVKTARTYEEIVDALRRMRDLHARGELPLNHEGRTFVLQNFARSDVSRRFAARLDSAVQEYRSRTSVARRRVAISGLELFCAAIANYAKASGMAWDPRLLRTNSRLEVLTSIYTIATSDIWYSIGSPINDRLTELFARILRKPRVIHWVGSDISLLSERPDLSKRLNAPGVTHLAEVNWTAQQLRALGVNSRIVPLPPRHRQGAITPMPDRFTVMLYVPRTRSDFYGRREFERLMRRFSGEPIRYLIVGGGEISIPAGVDGQNLGWRDALGGTYKDTSVLVRFTPRDGLSLMVLEALSFGRHVLWTQDFPHTTLIRTFDDMEREIAALLDLHLRGRLEPQAAAAHMIAEKYSAEKSMKAIGEAWDDALGEPAGGKLAAEAP
jgi:glycosyltransferase involved in cell wall biosynthesis